MFILCHTKLKEKTDLKTGEKYEQITNNLNDDVFSTFGDAAQMVMVGIIERNIGEKKVLGEKRVLYLRENLDVDAGSRFVNLPEKIDFTVDDFLKVFEQAVKDSMNTEPTDTDIKKIKKEEEKKFAESQKKAKEKLENKINVERNVELLEEIKQGYFSADEDTKQKIKDIMASYKIANLKSPEDSSTEGLEKISELLTI